MNRELSTNIEPGRRRFAVIVPLVAGAVLCLATLCFLAAQCHAASQEGLSVHQEPDDLQGSAIDGQRIISEVDSLMNTDSRMSISLGFYTEDGLDESYEMTSFTKDNNQKVIVRFSAPASSVGNDLIMLERNVWLYQKKAGRIVRVPSNLSFGGTGFSFGDIVRLNMTDSYNGEVVDQDEHAWKVELLGKDRGVPYDRIELTVAKDGFIPINATCYSRSGNVIKTIDYSEVEVVNGRRKPTVLTVRSPFADHEVSVMTFQAEMLLELPDHVFNRKNLALRLEERYDTEG